MAACRVYPVDPLIILREKSIKRIWLRFPAINLRQRQVKQAHFVQSDAVSAFKKIIPLNYGEFIQFHVAGSISGK
ncbi:hypothetical protein D3C73_1508940 [compost metagenome]